jgi:hypothetical protein
VKFQELAVITGERVGGRVGQPGRNGARERRNCFLNLFIVRRFPFRPETRLLYNGFAGCGKAKLAWSLGTHKRTIKITGFLFARNARVDFLFASLSTLYTQKG